MSGFGRFGNWFGAGGASPSAKSDAATGVGGSGASSELGGGGEYVIVRGSAAYSRRPMPYEEGSTEHLLFQILSELRQIRQEILRQQRHI